ncbi:MAG: TorD/DmsD family molecular chaperone [Candidatus Rokuibacteriota bacterium]
MLGDRELQEFREDYYGLFVSLLWREPPEGLVTGLSRGLQQRIDAAQGEAPDIAAGWRGVQAFLGLVPADQVGEAVREEYTRLFLGPPHPLLNLYESFYLTGHVLDRPLAVLRGDLKTLGIAKDPAYAEPEDFLAFELDIMRRLIRRQADAPDPDGETRWINAQATFLKRHLLVWAPTAAGDLAEARSGVFYRALGLLLGGFLDFERRLFQGWDLEPIATIDEARQSYAGTGVWRGPRMDVFGGGSPQGA